MVSLSQQCVPSPRAGHSSVVVGDKLFVFGGVTEDHLNDELSNAHSASQTMYLNDLVVFNFVKKMWEPMASTIKSMRESDILNEQPSCRAGHCMVAVGDNLYLFGGRFRGIIYNDLYLYNTSKITLQTRNSVNKHFYSLSLDSGRWSRVNATGDIPSERVGCSLDMAGTSDNPFLILLGGSNGQIVFNQLYLFAITENKWYLVNSIRNAPQSRYFHTTARIGEFLYLFGGGCGNGVGLLHKPLLDIHCLNLGKIIFFLYVSAINFDFIRSTL